MRLDDPRHPFNSYRHLWDKLCALSGEVRETRSRLMHPQRPHAPSTQAARLARLARARREYADTLADIRRIQADHAARAAA